MKNCRWSCERNRLNSENVRIGRIFHHVDIKDEEMSVKLSQRTSNEIWLLWIDEANRQLNQLNRYAFNWTLSFRRDSEISIGTYGLLINRSSIGPSENESNSLNFSAQIEEEISTNFRFRSRTALWFVSNCEPKRRLEFYDQLKKFYPVRSFGLCVPPSEKPCAKSKPCEENQSLLSMFYLAFESQTCRDYVTEKFWRSLFYGMIPIVLGPRKESYLDLSIPKSAFIHVDDFSSAEDLAKYLTQISTDYSLYRRFFAWKKNHEIFYRPEDLEPIRMCELCMRLNLQPFNERRFYGDLHRWHRADC